MSRDAIILSAGDTVATALRPMAAGETVHVHEGDGAFEVALGDAIPFGHKLALVRIEPDAPVLKYGNSIGRATVRIEAGCHVHTHNLISDRARPGKP